MINNQTQFGKLVLNYVSDEGDYYCTCKCGTKIILKEEQLKKSNSCGCENRKLLLSHTGIEDNTSEMDKLYNLTTQNESRGVTFEASKNKWRARITFQSKEYHLGYFDKKDDALKRKTEAEENLNGDFLGWYKRVYKK